MTKTWVLSDKNIPLPVAPAAKESASIWREISAVSACLLVCSPVDLEAAEAAFFSAGAGDEGGGGGDVAGAVGARVGVGGGGVVVAGVGDVGSHAAAQRFQMNKSHQK